jgi:hypothetical protein
MATTRYVELSENVAILILGVSSEHFAQRCASERDTYGTLLILQENGFAGHVN